MLSKFSSVVTAIALLSIVSGFGCNGGTLKPRDNNLDNGFRIGFALIRDMGLNSTTAVGSLQKNDSAITDAVMTVENYNLPFSSFRYLFETPSVDSIPAGPVVVTTAWSSDADTLSLTAPGNLTINSLLPPIKGPGDRVYVDWTASAGTETYVIVAVKRDSAYMGMGFSQYVTSLTPSETVEDSAFFVTNLQGSEPNPGIYNVYVYAVNGSPDSALTSIELPVPLPSQLTENVTDPDYKMFGGVITVSAPVIVDVVAEP